MTRCWYAVSVPSWIIRLILLLFPCSAGTSVSFFCPCQRRLFPTYIRAASASETPENCFIFPYPRSFRSCLDHLRNPLSSCCACCQQEYRRAEQARKEKLAKEERENREKTEKMLADEDAAAKKLADDPAVAAAAGGGASATGQWSPSRLNAGIAAEQEAVLVRNVRCPISSVAWMMSRNR